MEDNNLRRQNRKNLNKKNSGRTAKKVLIALLLLITIPAAVGMGYMYYMANQIETNQIDDPIWDKPLEDPVATGESTDTGVILPTEEELAAQEEEFLKQEGIATGETETEAEVTEEGYVITDDGKVVTDMGEYETDVEEDSDSSADSGKSTKPKTEDKDYAPPKNTNSLGIEPNVEDKINKFPVVKNNKIKNVLLLGVDSSSGSGRSDTIMIMSVDQTTKKIKLSSIMRDSYVYIEGHGMDKINHAYAFGGARLALKTVNSNFNMNIKDFAVVNFSQLPRIVDSVGGVAIALTEREAKYMGFSGGAKTYQLDGAQALRYSRIRKIDSDFARTNRQRVVLKAILNKLMSLSPAKVPGVANQMLPMVRTTLSANEIISTGVSVVSSNYSVVGRVFPPASASRGAIINGVWYLKFDRDKQARALYSFIFNQ